MADAEPTFTHVRTLTVEWGDCDPAGIVFYPRYFAMFDAATHALFTAATGLLKRDLLATYDIIGTPMVDTRAVFHAPCRFGDAVVIESAVTQFRRSSFDILHRLCRDGRLAVDCTETRVWTGRDPDRPDAIKAKAIPPAVTACFGPR